MRTTGGSRDYGGSEGLRELYENLEDNRVTLRIPGGLGTTGETWPCRNPGNLMTTERWGTAEGSKTLENSMVDLKHNRGTLTISAGRGIVGNTKLSRTHGDSEDNREMGDYGGNKAFDTNWKTWRTTGGCGDTKGHEALEDSKRT